MHSKRFRRKPKMPQPRKNIISIEDTPYYHCIGRCVRRAFLCGKDEFSGKDYTHRRQWVVDRLKLLSSVFAIDLCGYAVMSNHYHLVLRLSPEHSHNWTQSEVIERWQKLYSGGPLVRMYQSGECLSDDQQMMLDTQIETWKERLTNISWYMRSLNEYLARMANKEDDCTGRFWEGRFKSQALLDEASLITCMTYVDLNPIRANIANTPETSDFTSIKERIRKHLGKPHQSKHLLNMDGDNHQSSGLPISLKDYLELIDWSGRAILEDKPGFIKNKLPPILTRLQIEPRTWVKQMNHFGKRWYRVIGSKHKIKSLATKIGLNWMNGQGKSSPFREIS